MRQYCFHLMVKWNAAKDFTLLIFKDFAKDRYGVSAMVQSQQKLG